MVDQSMAGSLSSGKNRLKSLAAGFLIAAACFTLALALLAYVVPVFVRSEAPWLRFLFPVSITLFAAGGLIRWFRARSKERPAARR